MSAPRFNHMELTLPKGVLTEQRKEIAELTGQAQLIR